MKDRSGDKDPPSYEAMSSRERAICSTLCLCLLLSVLSAVALIYLSVIIYLPAHRELTSGIASTAVMCTTREFRRVHGDIVACRWSSCSEWCLSKGGGDCNHLYVSVRANGTDVELEDCERAAHRRCRSLDLASVGTSNCKQDGECVGLDGFQRCEDGLCRNISSVYECRYDPADAAPGAPVSCAKKRNCVELDGMFDCRGGDCTRVHEWRCERRCRDIDTRGRNVVLVGGDDILLGRCRRAIDTRTGLTIWDAARHPGRTVVASCTRVSNRSAHFGLLTGYDCVNGSLIPSELLLDPAHPAGFTNYSLLTHNLLSLSPLHPLDRDGVACPFEQDITIYNRSRLMINTEGCVNTLREECNAFYASHGSDGRNQTSPSRFPCFYAPASGEYVVSHFDASRTKGLFLLFFVVPAGLLVASCGFLFMCSRMLNVDNTGHMILKCCWKSDIDFGLGGFDDAKSLNNGQEEDDDDEEDGELDEEELNKRRRRGRKGGSSFLEPKEV